MTQLKLMHKTVNPIPLRCTMCGAGPWRPQESKTKDRYGNIIHEAKWVCGACLRAFEHGTTKIEENKNV